MASVCGPTGEMAQRKTLWLRNVHGEDCFLPMINVSDNDTMFDVVSQMKQNCELFSLHTDQIRLDTICLIEADTNKRVQLSTMVARFTDGQRFLFNLKGTVDVLQVSVSYATRQKEITFECDDNDLLSDLAAKIQCDIKRFDLPEHINNIVQKKGTEIMIFCSKEIKGDEHKALDQTKHIGEVNYKNGFIFEVRDKKVNLSDLKINGQRIALLGAPGSGISSFINTTFTALNGRYMNIATTFNSSEAAGSRVSREYNIKAKDRKLTLYDIPGIYSINSKDTIIERLLNGELMLDVEPIRKAYAADYWCWWGWVPKPTAIIIVQKGGCSPSWCSGETVKVAGSRIPVFAVITHLDKIPADQIGTQVDSFHQATRLCREHIFTVTNYAQSDYEIGGLDPLRNKHVLEIWKHILQECPNKK